MKSPEDSSPPVIQPSEEHKGGRFTRRRLLALFGIGLATQTIGDTSQNQVGVSNPEITNGLKVSKNIAIPKIYSQTESNIETQVQLTSTPVELKVVPSVTATPVVSVTETTVPKKLEQNNIKHILMEGVEIVDPQLSEQDNKWDSNGNYILAGSGDLECRLLVHATDKNYQNASSKLLSINASEGDIFSLIDNQNLPLQQLTFDKSGIIKVLLPLISARFGFMVHRNNISESVKVSHDLKALSQNDQQAIPIIDVAEAMRKQPLDFSLNLNTTTDLSREFDIAPQTISEMVAKLGQNYDIYVATNYPEAKLHPGSPPKEWSREQIRLLGIYLSVLPSYFFAPESSGKPLVVTNLGAIRMDRTCATATCNLADEEAAVTARQSGQPFPLQEFQIQVTLDPEGSLTLREVGLEAVAHECTHRIYNNNSKAFNKFIVGIFGEPFEYTAQKYTAIVVKARNSVLHSRLDLNDASIDQASFIDTINYGLTGNLKPNTENVSITDNGDISILTIPDEFICVLSQHYLHGKKIFTQMYELVFSPQIVEQLYEFTKDNIYKGIEYQQFPQL